MLPTSPAIVAAAQAASATPAVRVRLFDRDALVPRLRPVPWYQGAEPEGPAGIALPADGALLRARIDPGDGTLYVQRVDDPDDQADYTAWTALDDAEPGPGLGLHAAGMHVLIAYCRGTAIRTRSSTDGGATFGTAADVAFSSDVAGVGCAVRPDGAALVAWSVLDELYTNARPGGGSFGSSTLWPHALDAVTSVAVTDAGDWALLVAGEDGDGRPGVWSTMLGTGLVEPPGSWTALAPVLVASPGLDVSYRATAAVLAGAPRALLVESYAGTGAFDRALIATAPAGGAWEEGAWGEPEPLDHAGPWGLAAAVRSTEVYLAAAETLWDASPDVAFVDVSHAVVSLQLEASRTHDHLRLVLDRPGVMSSAAAVFPGAEVDVAAGYVTDSGPLYVAGRVYWVRTTSLNGATLVVTAEGARSRLGRWRAPRQVTWPAGARTVAGIATELVRRAGLRAVTGAASTDAHTLTPGFGLRAGEAAGAALDRLLERVPDQLRARGVELHLLDHDPGEAAAYALGEDHPLSALVLRAAEGVPRAMRVLGTGVAAEALHAAGAGIAVVVDPAVTDAGVALARARASLRRAELGAELATVEAAPHPGLEPGDVVALTDPALGLEDRPYRVIAVELEHARRPRGQYRMRLTLGAV